MFSKLMIDGIAGEAKVICCGDIDNTFQHRLLLDRRVKRTTVRTKARG